MRRLLGIALLVACSSAQTEVAVLGVVHSKKFTPKVIRTVRSYKPQVVFVEIPPHLFKKEVKVADKRGFETTREYLEERTRWIKYFPNVYAGVLPLRKEMGYAVEPVSGWREAVSSDRKRFWDEHGKDPEVVRLRGVHDRAKQALDEIVKREGSTLWFLNTPHYTDAKRIERSVWSACFDEGLGRGGEVAINTEHYNTIERALKRHASKRILIVYGAAHRYWFIDRLVKNKAVTLVDILPHIPR